MLMEIMDSVQRRPITNFQHKPTVKEIHCDLARQRVYDLLRCTCNGYSAAGADTANIQPLYVHGTEGCRAIAYNMKTYVNFVVEERCQLI